MRESFAGKSENRGARQASRAASRAPNIVMVPGVQVVPGQPLSPADILALQPVIGNQAVLRKLASQSPAAPRGSSALVQRGFFDDAKRVVLKAAITGLRGAQELSIAGLRQLGAFLPANLQSAYNMLVDAMEAISDIFVSLLLAIIGVVSGFSSEIVDIVMGLIKVAYKILELMAAAIVELAQELIDAIAGTDFDSNAYTDRINALAADLSRMGDALRAVIDQWQREFERADSDRQTVMIGELTGRLLAVIATAGLAAAKAGTAAGRMGSVAARGGGELALAGGGQMSAGAGLVTEAGTAVAQGVAAGGVLTAAMVGKAGGGGGPSAESGEMLGSKGTQMTSKTVWKGKKGMRIDVENPNPGQRPGQIHFQQGDAKYLYDPQTQSFIGAPKRVNDLLKTSDMQQALAKGLRFLGETK